MKKEFSKVLYIDDENSNLIAFNATFKKDYKVFTAIDTKTALEILDQDPQIGVIVCDERLQKESGFEFLKKLHEDKPKIMKIILTAYTDYRVMQNALNSGIIYKFVLKPWKKTELKSFIDIGCNVYYLRTEKEDQLNELRKLKDIIEEMAMQVNADKLKKMFPNLAKENDLLN